MFKVHLSVKSIIRSKLKRVHPNVHKGNFGRVFIIAGSRGFTGASRLAAMGALRAGAGLVTVGAPKSLTATLTRDCLEAMWLGLPETKQGSISRAALGKAQLFLEKQDVLAVGPGLSRHASTLSFIRALLLKSHKPMVVDADAIISFCGKRKLLQKLRAPAILTPHPGEFKNLFGIFPRTERERVVQAKKAAKDYRIVMVLKGYRTVVADRQGRCYVNKTGNPGMATGGMGDILTGIIAAFLGQKLEPFEAACAAVFVHGLTGDRASKIYGKVSLLPRDLLEQLPQALKAIIGS